MHEEIKTVGIVLLTGDRGLAGGFNSNIIRHGLTLHDELSREGKDVSLDRRSARRASAPCVSVAIGIKESIQGITDRPKYTDAEDIAHRIACHVYSRRARPGPSGL